MRRLLLLGVCSIFVTSVGPAYAFGPFGSLQTYARNDYTSVGIGYFLNTVKMKPDSSGFSPLTASQNQGYLEILGSGISMTEEGSGFLRIGAADFDDGKGFKGTFTPYGTIGMKEVWYGEGRNRFKVGTILHASYYGNFEDTQGSETVTVKSQWDVDLGISLQGRVTDTLIVYGGPLLYYGTAKVTRDVGSVSTSSNYEMEDLVGAFGGIRFSISKSWAIEIEGQYRGDFSAGASVAYAF